MLETVVSLKKHSETIHVDRGKVTRRLARERVGRPPVEKVITPKPRRKPKYPEKIETDGAS